MAGIRLDDGVARREAQALMAVVVPAHQVRRTSVLTVHLEDLAVPIRFGDMTTLHDHPVTNTRSHGRPSYVKVEL
jgi:hypothetical protein